MMEGSPGAQAQSESQNLTHREVDGLLLSSKKIRYRNRKACYPCNKRKIKCDRDEQPAGQPCTNCRKRPHPELCSYEDQNPRSSGGSTRSVNQHNRPATPSQHDLQYGAPPAQAQPLLPGIHAASAGYVQEASHPDGQGHATWHTPQPGNYQSSFESSPYIQTTTGPSPRPPEKRSAESVAHEPGRGIALNSYQPTLFSAHSAGLTHQTPTLWEEINSLLPPQKHILRYARSSFFKISPTYLYQLF